MFPEILILLFLLFLSALFAGSEICFIVANRLKIELKAQSKVFAAQQAINFLNNPQSFFSIILIGNNFSNVAFSSLFAVFIVSIINLDPTYIMLITTLLLLVFGEVIPKIFFRENADRFVSLFTIFLIFWNIVLYPIIHLVNKFINKIIQLLKIPSINEKIYYTKEDFYEIIRESSKLKRDKNLDLSILEKSFELLYKDVKDLMIPRIEIVAVEKSDNLKKIKELVIQNNLSFLLVFQESIDNIVGYIEIHDLLLEQSSIDEIIKPVMYIPETKSCANLLQEFQTQKKEIAIVIDEYGGTSGVITLMDILGEVIGRFEHDSSLINAYHKKLDENTYIFSGRIELNFVNEKYNLCLESETAVTIGGWILEKIGFLPLVGEMLEIDSFLIKVLKVSKTRIELIELKISEK